jgi:hypothetical protein
LRVHATLDVRDLGGDQGVRKSLEVHNLIFTKGAYVSLTHLGKVVARRV